MRRVQPHLLRNLGGVARAGEVLLVGEDEEQRVLELLLVDQAVELLGRLLQPRAVGRVDDEDERLR